MNLRKVLVGAGPTPWWVKACFALAAVFSVWLGVSLASDGAWMPFHLLDTLAGGEFSASIETISLLMLACFVLFIIVLGMPIAFATGLVAVIFCVVFRDIDALSIITFRTYGFINSYVLLSVPMFLLMAAILDKSGVAHDLYDALKIWAGNLPGGVAVMTLIAASVMAAMTGIIGGEIILLGLVALPQMLRLGYDPKLAIGVVCAGARWA